MITIKPIAIIAIFIPLFISLSCSESACTENNLTEGLIEYNAEVVDQNHPMAGLAPSTATVKFKKNKVYFDSA